MLLGFDYDGVVIYNPLHVARAPIAWFKSHFLGLNKTSFYKPQTGWQFFIWKLLFFYSLPAKSGLAELARLKRERSDLKTVLLTGRFHLSKDKIEKTLAQAGYPKIFDEIITNDDNLQPHEFKEKIIVEKKIEVYFEDNVDIVLHLAKNCPQTKIVWLYNILDRRFDYSPKFPTLKEAVKSL